MSAVPTASPRIFFQLFSSHLAYHEFSKQCGECEQQDNWCHRQEQRDSGVCKFFSGDLVAAVPDQGVGVGVLQKHNPG